VIETERLLLRPHLLDDYEPYFSMLSDPDFKTPAGQTISAEEAWHRVLRYAGHWALLGYGTFAIIEKSTGQYVGETGLWDYHRFLGDDFDTFDEAGWSLSPKYQKRGFAFEAAQAAHQWHRQQKGNHRTVCMIDPDNGASILLAKKLNYRIFRKALYKGHSVLLLERVPD